MTRKRQNRFSAVQVHWSYSTFAWYGEVRVMHVVRAVLLPCLSAVLPPPTTGRYVIVCNLFRHSVNRITDQRGTDVDQTWQTDVAGGDPQSE